MFHNDCVIIYSVFACVFANKSIRDRVAGWTEREEDIFLPTYISINPLMCNVLNYLVHVSLFIACHSFC